MAARALFGERGSADAVVLDEVAARAGTTRATIYRHVADKAALMAEVGAPLEEGPGAPGHLLRPLVLLLVVAAGLVYWLNRPAAIAPAEPSLEDAFADGRPRASGCNPIVTARPETPG